MKKPSKPVKTLSESLTRALAGMPPSEEEVPPQASSEVVPPVVPETPAEPKAETVPVPEPKAEVVPPVEPPKEDALVSHLKGEITSLKSENTQLTEKLFNAGVAAKNAADELTTLKGLVTNAEAGIRVMTQRMSIGLGMNLAGIDTLSGEMLMQQFNAVKTKFDQKFISGGKSSTTAQDVSQPENAESVGDSQRRRIKATKM